MRRDRAYLQRAARLAYRVRNRLWREVVRSLEKLSHLYAPTFRLTDDAWKAPLSQRFSFLSARFVPPIRASESRLAWLVQKQTESFLKHRFDLLGSGPTDVAHGIQCKGVHGTSYPANSPVRADLAGRWLAGRINSTNLNESQRLWQLVSPDYVPIDWQLDFKSGYRWRENTWHRDIKFEHLPGVDVKVPWELARLQHLPALALACHFASANVPGFQNAKVYAQEFRNQALDFIATNPPGFGVNWVCAMDVAIRCANLLVARDIVVTSGVQLDEAFECTFAASIVTHARHIIKNLEWAPAYRGNHYLANIVGLLFAAAYLPRSEEVDSWLAFSVQELVAEVEYQFHEDGTNFEASVCYHRLSAEMVLWVFALLCNLPTEKLEVLTQPDFQRRKRISRLLRESWVMHPVPESDRMSPVPPWCWDRLERMADFTEAMTRPDGAVTQFGDNDSGRFLTICSEEQMNAANDPSSPLWSLDHSALVIGIRSLLGQAPDSSSVGHSSAWLIRGFAGFGEKVVAHSYLASAPRSSCHDASMVSREQAWSDSIGLMESTPSASRWTSSFAVRSSSLLVGLERFAFPGIGCYVIRAKGLFMAIRCGEIGVAGLGPHAHCDQLAIELVIDGKDLVRDPGTYVYTPIPDKRNAYRSASAHHAPHVSGREPADLTLGLFDLRGAADGECLYFGPRGFVGRHSGYGRWVYRIVSLDEHGITISDFAEGGLLLADSAPAYLPVSPAYGRVLESTPSPS